MLGQLLEEWWLDGKGVEEFLTREAMPYKMNGVKR